MALLKRLDLLISALFWGAAAAPISSSFFCAESSCHSAPDMARFYGLGALTTALAIALLWRLRRWSLRIFVLPLSLYASYVLPAWTARHGQWTVLVDSEECLVRAGDARDEIRRRCGAPTYACSGPKSVESGIWNPFSVEVCGFSGDVYAKRIVAYNCQGWVANVREFDPGSIGGEQPHQCVTREIK